MGLPTHITSNSDIDILLGGLSAKIRDELQLWQYYVLDRHRERNGVLSALAQSNLEWSNQDMRGKSFAELADFLKSTNQIKGLGEFRKRYGVHVDPEQGASLIRAAFPDLRDFNALADAWGSVIDIINEPLYREWEEDTRVALEHIKNRMEYTRLAEHGPKLGEITAK